MKALLAAVKLDVPFDWRQTYGCEEVGGFFSVVLLLRRNLFRSFGIFLFGTSLSLASSPLLFFSELLLNGDPV